MTATLTPRTYSADQLGDPLPLDSLTVGQEVVAYVRGRYRNAIVRKVGRKNVRVQTTSPTAVREAHERAITRDAVARLQSDSLYQARLADRYRREAEMIERLGIEPTSGRKYPDSPFVPLASLPPEYAALDAETGSNGARTTIVNSPEQLREWADGCERQMARNSAKRAEAEAWDAAPYEERFQPQMTSKSVPEVYAVPEEES